MTDILETIREMVVGGKFKDIEKEVQRAVDSGTDLNLLINDALISAMDIVGKRFADGDIYVPEMLVSAKTMKQGLDIIKPLLTAGEAEHRGTIVMGTVKGDLHDIGKNLVIMMMEGAGFRIVDMGVDVKIEDLIDTVKKEEADVLGLSALLTTTMPEMQKVIVALDEAGLRDQLKVIVGGAPIDQRFADEIGADGFGADAVEAVQLAREIVAGK
ncbi:MAG: corrinoid protein [Desulfobacteraceae bacterium]|jgi:5-methyltetrahydrofolate--homocysteine methyltransferase|nr:corrinoid protein [Desulfobacteraceae bacterium]